MQSSIAILSIVLLMWIVFWYAVSRVLRRMDVADIAWGLGVALLAFVSLRISQAATPLRIALTAAAVMWGVRLACHVYSRSRGRPEDARYRAWRQAWGARTPVRSFFQVFVLQTLLLTAVSLPMLMLNLGPAAEDPNVYLFVTGALLFLFGFAFESIADWQLARFLGDASNTGKVMRVGLWRRSRHPNYFGEVVLWWGLGVMALCAGASFIVLLSPLLVTLLIVKVSGIPMLEQKMAHDPKYADYIAETNVFLPVPCHCPVNRS